MVWIKEEKWLEISLLAKGETTKLCLKGKNIKKEANIKM